MATTAKKTTAAPESAEAPKPKATDEGVNPHAQAKFDEANAQGYFGSTPDETPREHYTLAGVTADKPTPENQRAK